MELQAIGKIYTLYKTVNVCSFFSSLTKDETKLIDIKPYDSSTQAINDAKIQYRDKNI